MINHADVVRCASPVPSASVRNHGIPQCLNAEANNDSQDYPLIVIIIVTCVKYAPKLILFLKAPAVTPRGTLKQARDLGRLHAAGYQPQAVRAFGSTFSPWGLGFFGFVRFRVRFTLASCIVGTPLNS